MRFARILAVTALVLAPSAALAQSFTGTVVGTVKDSSGAAIPHATITITSQQTGRQASVTADLEGRYTSLPLPPGEYRVEASLQGFRPAARSNVTVQIASTVVVDFALEVGELTEAVEVTASTGALETTSSTVGKVVDNRRIQELPLNTRNVYSLIFLTPGVAGTIGNNYNSMSYIGERRAADDDGYGHRRRDGVVPDGQRLHRHLGVPLGRRHPGIQGDGRELPGGVRPQPRQRAQRRLQVGHQRLPRQRLRVLPRLGVRREQLLRGAARARRSATSSAASSAASPAARSGAGARSS